MHVVGRLRAMYVGGATPLARRRARGARRGARALARSLGAADGGGGLVALRCALARPVADALERVEVALDEYLALRLAQTRRDEREGYEADVEEDADHEDDLAGDDAD